MNNVTVHTVVTKSDGTSFWDDTMNWYGVDEEVVQWLAGSCKLALFKLIGVPEVTSGNSYTLSYRTVVTDAATGKVVSDTTMIDFPKLSYDTICEFQRFAIDELLSMQELLQGKHANKTVITKKRNKLLSLINIISQRVRNLL